MALELAVRSNGAASRNGSRGRRGAWVLVGLLHSRKVAVGLFILCVALVVALAGPIVYPRNPSAMSGALLAPPSGAHLLGTTQMGQDVLAQLIDGTRVSLLVGFTSGAIATFIALLVGLTAGYLAGTWGELLSALANIFLVIPGLPLVIVLAGYLPTKGWLPVAAVISATGWAWGARVLRAQTMSLAKRDFVQASRATGEKPLRIIFAEILPNQLPIVASGFLGTVIYAILTQASLAFLGLSDVSQWSWGTMLYWAESNQALQVGAWWWFVPPGLAIAVVAMGLTLINFGIDELVNPRLRAGGIGTKAWAKALARQSDPEHGPRDALRGRRSTPVRAANAADRGGRPGARVSTGGAGVREGGKRL